MTLLETIEQSIDNFNENELAEIKRIVSEGVFENTQIDYNFILKIILNRMNTGVFDPLDFSNIFNNKNFIGFLNKYISDNLTNLLKNPNVYTFSEISNYISLLGLGKYSDIVNDLDSCNLNLLSELLNYYLQKINESKNNEEFQILFDSYYILLNSINTLCILDQVNTYRKKIIPDILKIIDKNILELQSILFKNKNYSQDNLKLINHFSGVLKINFSHINYFSNTNDFNDLIDEFYNIFDNQYNGFKQSSKSNFGNIPNKKNTIENVFIGNFSYTLSLLIYKVGEEKLELLNNDKRFQEILKIFGSFFGDEKLFDGKDIYFVKNFCNNIFGNFLYKLDLDFENFGKENSVEKVIEDFCNPDFLNYDYVIESIHNLLLFNNLDDKNLLKLGKFILSTKPYNNYSFEFYKLKILDLIVDRLKTTEKNYFQNIIFYKEILSYIEENKTGSQLLYGYTSIYLTISYNLSNYSSSDSLDKSVLIFSKFLNFNENIQLTILKYNLDDYYLNIGKKTIEKILTNSFFDKYDLNESEIIKVGKEVVRKGKNAYSKEIELNLKDKLKILSNKAIDWDDNFDDKFLLEELSNIFSKETFLGICNIFIQDKDNTNNLNKNGANVKIESLNEKFNLIFSYPSLYKDVFNKIFESKIDYLKEIIIEVISNYYQKNKTIYEDKVTQIPNETQLKRILNNNNKNYNFINIKITNLGEINSVYGIDVGNNLLKDFANSLKFIDFDGKISIFRLSGSKIGMLLLKDIESGEIIEIIEKIKKYSFKNINNNIHINTNIGVVTGETKSIIEKSNIALQSSKTTNNNIGYYENDDNFLNQKKLELEYSTKLSDAIEESRILTYYQPIVNLRTGIIDKYEVLMRVKSKDGNEIESPYFYLESAVRDGKMSEIAKIQINSVFEKSSINLEKQFSINLSGMDFLDENLFNFILQKLDLYKNLNPNNIILEVLESECKDYDKVIESMRKYKKLGFKISIDDYGAEQSNIHRTNLLLEKGLADFVKIDGSIIKELDSLDNKKVLVSKADIENVIKKSEIYGFKVVAEFIENKKIFDYCSLLGLDYGQGYFIGKPNGSLEIKK